MAIVICVSRLGFGEPLAISASHGDGMADFATALVPHYEEWEREQEVREKGQGDSDIPIFYIFVREVFISFGDVLTGDCMRLRAVRTALALW